VRGDDVAQAAYIQSTAVTVLIVVTVPKNAAHGSIFVCRPVAVVIDPVAILGGPGVHVGVHVVAVPGNLCGVRFRRIAQAARIRRQPEPVVIEVPIVGDASEGVRLVDDSVAVVVHAIASFLCGRVDLNIGVIAVAPSLRQVGSDGSTQTLGIAAYAEAIEIIISIVYSTASGPCLVHLPIAVVVLAVAQFRRAGANIGIIVITVSRKGGRKRESWTAQASADRR